jgi:hypothetical protein
MTENTKSATRADVVRIAEENPVPGSKELVSAIREANNELKFSAATLLRNSTHANEQAQADTFVFTGSFMKAAAEHEVAGGKLNTLILTLAILLQSNGVEVNY